MGTAMTNVRSIAPVADINRRYERLPLAKQDAPLQMTAGAPTVPAEQRSLVLPRV